MDLFFKALLLFSCDIVVTLCATIQNQGWLRSCVDGHFFVNNENIKTSIKYTAETEYDSSTKLCKLIVESMPGYRLRAIINYSPEGPADCQKQYVHIGNDRHRLNKPSLTSYIYCNKTVSEEIVSRKNHVWIVYSKPENKTDLRIDISALKEVVCLAGEFQCSPLQCVNTTNVCDDILHCDNGRDEYCHTVADISAVDKPCFQCNDGTCIRPTLPRYHDNWGQPLWYLCDGHDHCTDATDERPDICTHIRGRLESVIECRTAKQQGLTKLIWKADIECGHTEDCEFTWRQKEQLLCSDNVSEEESSGNRLFVPVIVVAIAVISIATGFCVIHKIILLREKNPPSNNTDTQLSHNFTTDHHGAFISDNASERSLQEQSTQQQNKLVLCHNGRLSREAESEEEQCFISTV